MDHPFDRPVFIVAAPRSCSTLLFETLTRAGALCSVGDESHGIFEGHRKLSPGRGAVDSNRLGAELLDPALAASIRARFGAKLRDRDGAPPGAGAFRLLEKTPKNALRIPFLDALFPDARFIYLVRDPHANLASIIEGWRAGRFVTYPRIRTVHGPWSFLLPPGWQEYTRRPLEEIAAFQWSAANRFVVEDLSRIDPRRWTALHADALVQDPPGAVARLCEFMEIELDQRLRASLAQPLPLSRYTMTPPAPHKWQAHAAALQRVWPGVTAVVRAIDAFAGARLGHPLAATAESAA
jgi:hypothetical protein